MGSALNSVLQSQINSLTGNLKNASLSVGIKDRTAAETGDKQTDYSFRYSQRFFNDRVQIIIGGKVSSGANATNDVESFIDNISLEYRLDNSATHMCACSIIRIMRACSMERLPKPASVLCSAARWIVWESCSYSRRRRNRIKKLWKLRELTGVIGQYSCEFFEFNS